MPSQYPPLVSVGLVTWNSAVHLSACLNALAQQAYPSLELIVVDNASVDDSTAQVKALYPRAHLVCNTVNTGYCGGHNQAIRISRGAYYLPLNPDVVMKPDYVAALVGALENPPQHGAAAGKLIQADGPQPIVRSTGPFMDRKPRPYLRA